MTAPAAGVSPAPRDPWREVSDAVLRGLNHALSNRLAALAAVAAVITPGDPPGAELAGTLHAEVARSEQVLRLLRLLPASRATAEPVLLADLLADARALHAHHAGLGELLCDVEGDVGALLPLVAPSRALTHALVLLLGALALHARAGGKTAVLRCGGDERFVRLVGEAPGPGGAVAGGAALHPEEVAAALAPLVATAGGTVAVSAADVGARYEVELPTLLTVRRRERGG